MSAFLSRVQHSRVAQRYTIKYLALISKKKKKYTQTGNGPRCIWMIHSTHLTYCRLKRFCSLDVTRACDCLQCCTREQHPELLSFFAWTQARLTGIILRTDKKSNNLFISSTSARTFVLSYSKKLFKSFSQDNHIEITMAIQMQKWTT